MIVILALVPHSQDGDLGPVLNLKQNKLSRQAKWHDQFAQKRVVFVRLPAREGELFEDLGRFSQCFQRMLRGRYVAIQEISVKAQDITTGTNGIADTVLQ